MQTGAIIQTRTVHAPWLGRVGYDDALALQAEAAAKAAAGEESLLLLEHDPVYTLGRNASERDVLLPSERLRELGIAVRESDRGGKVTYHGPGQLVGYPILNLAPDRKDVRRYVRDVEEILIRTLGNFGIRAERSTLKDRVTSVWVGNDKIAAIGIHLARWVTTHGFALNVTNEALAAFGGIVPCGITDGGVTSMEQQLGRPVELAELLDPIRSHFSDVFGREIVPS